MLWKKRASRMLAVGVLGAGAFAAPFAVAESVSVI